ncbi:MAG: virulence RhuM family protein [Bacillota bacterium]
MNSEMIIYTSIDGSTKIDVQVEDETVWLSQMQMTELFQTSKQNISLHINNTFKEGELDEIAVVKESLTTASDGKSYRVKLYNLDVIISVGYRVKSLRGTEFRKWAMNILREYLIKGFTINDEKLKQAGGGSYWKELLERIRDIRSSEKVLYRQVLDLYATSVDYSPKAEETVEFFKVVQNKLHYATHKSTASEVIYQRANSELPFMGLTTFKGDRPIKSETRIAKNYLKEDELAVLNRLVTAFFDLAELRAMRREPMYMKDWVVEIDDFAQRYGQGVLIGGGSISNKQAIIKADQEYEKYKKLEDELLSPVEKEYIDALKKTQKQIETSKK